MRLWLWMILIALNNNLRELVIGLSEKVLSQIATATPSIVDCS